MQSVPAAARRRNQAASASASASTLADVTFTVTYRAEFGQALKIVGESSLLGSWQPADAPSMAWTDGDVWTLTLGVPPGDYEFKIAVTGEGRSVTWEDGPNRAITVPSVDGSADGAGGYMVSCEWGNPGSTALQSRGPDSVPTESDEEAPFPAEDVSGEVTGVSTNDEGSMPPAAKEAPKEVGKMTVEGVPGAGEGADATEGHGAQEVGKMTVDSSGLEAASSGATSNSTSRAQVDSESGVGGVSEVGKMTVDSSSEAGIVLQEMGGGHEEGAGAAAAMTPTPVEEHDLETPVTKVVDVFLKVPARFKK